MYLEKFVLPDSEEEHRIAYKKRNENGGYLDNGYPCGLFTPNILTEIDFDKVTVICGGNGSGKSTLLNIIANKLELKRLSPHNSGELFSAYVDICSYRLAIDDEGSRQKIPNASRIITSDDVFEYMLAVRAVNEEVSENIEEGKSDYAALKYGESIRLDGMESYEEFRLQVLSRKKSLTRRKFLRQLAGKEVTLNSNGETAIDFFSMKFKNDALYCLDEPENSLSPQMQLKLKDIIEEKSRYCGCQFIIATHSPFLLAINRAKIYNLDKNPVSLDKWWEVDNAKTYFDFFYAHKHLFLKK